MTTIEVTSHELVNIISCLANRAREDKERAVLLTKGLLGVPHNNKHPNRDLAQAFLEQAHDIKTLAEKLEAQV